MTTTRAGTRLGPYEISARIGAGGMGEVWAARDTRLDREVAVKLLPPDVAGDAERVERFRREARLLAALNHPNVAQVYGLEEEGGSLAIALELVPGEDLAERVERGPVPVDEAVRIVREAASGLAAAHAAGIVHRDLKPANVRVRPDGSVKVLDFGLARRDAPPPPSDAPVSEAATLDPQGGTRAGVVLGTPAYMAPEQARGLPADARADVWGLGLLLFEMLAARRPFAGPTLSDTIANVLLREPDWSLLPAGTPDAVRALLGRCLQKEPANRPSSAGEVRDALGGGTASAAGPAPAGRAETPSNLPLELSTLVGREADAAAVADALGRSRLVTLTGPGGCGKSRLALRAAAAARARYPDGTWWLDLAPVASNEDVPLALARAIGLREEHGRPVTDTLAEQLRDRRTLLVLDGAEHLLDGVARLAGALLRSVPGLSVLLTSRECAGLPGELRWNVPPLDAGSGDRLFVERAALVRPGYVPDAAERAAIRTIVERLDGLPLALELAAARLRVTPPARLLAALDDRFRVLTGGDRTALPRQRTLEASIAWSYDLLEPEERSLAARLSVLHGFTLETAAAVAGRDDLDELAVSDLLARLVDKSFLGADAAAGETRYRFLESVRQFLLARLRDSGEEEEVRGRHLDRFVALAEELAPGLALGDGPALLARLEAEHANLDQALERAERSAADGRMLRLVAALGLFYELRGHLGHGGRWMARALAASPAEASALRARALWAAAHVAFYGGRYADAEACATEGLEVATRVGDAWATARSLNTLGVLQAFATPDAARRSLSRSVAEGRSIGDEWAVADGWKMLTVVAYVTHDEAAARPLLDELRRAGERLRSRFFLAWDHALRGYFARDRGDLAEARAELDLSLDDARDVGDPSTGGFAEAWAAALDADLGDRARARRRLESLLASAAASGSELAAPEAAMELGRIALSEGAAAEAIDLVTPVADTLRPVGVPGWTAGLLLVRAAGLRALGRRDEAAAALDEAATLAAPLANAQLDGRIASEQGLLAAARGDRDRARALLERALSVQTAAGLHPDASRTRSALAGLERA